MAQKQTTSAGKRSKKTPKKSAPKTKDAIKTGSALRQNTSENKVPSQNLDIYTDFANGISALLEESKHLAAHSVNAILTATYWEMGRRIVEIEQNGQIRAEYGTQLLLKLSQDLIGKFGRGFSVDTLERMRMFYNAYPQILDSITENTKNQRQAWLDKKSASVMRKSVFEEIGEYLTTLAQAFPLSWTHYIRLMSIKRPEARSFYESEAIIIDLKVGQFTHADVGQMNLYLNYALEHLTLPDENPPVGLILCSEHDKSAAHYALGNMLNKVMASEYQLSLPDPNKLEEEIEKTRRLLQRMPKLRTKSKQKTANKKSKKKVKT